MALGMSKTVWLGLLIAASSIAMNSPAAFSEQRPRSVAERRQSPGKGYWENHRVSRNIQHARDFASSIHRYATQAPSFNRQVAKAESEILGQQIESTSRELTAIREAHGEDRRVIEQAKSVEAKLAEAASAQEMLHEECCKDAPDGVVCSDMASRITSSLDKVASEHAKLLQIMGHQDVEYGHQHTLPGNAEHKGESP